MATLTVNPTNINVTDVNQNTVSVDFTCDKILTDVKLSTDNGNTYRDKLSMTQTNAVFSISGMSNNNYSCKLKGYYEEEEIPSIVPVSSVSLDKNSHTFTSLSTLQLTATILPSNATNKSVTWSSSNTNIATVSSTGLVTAKANGSATITATTVDGAKTATCAITVNVSTQPSGSIVLESTTHSIRAGESLRLKATVSLEESNPVYEIRRSGSVFATAYMNSMSKEIIADTSTKTAGTYTNLTVVAKSWVNKDVEPMQYVDIATSQEFTLTVTSDEGGGGDTSVTGVTLSETSKTLEVGQTFTLTANVLPSNATNKNVTWSTNSSDVAEVVNGTITAKKSGNATIAATTQDGNKTATCSVTVNATSGGGDISISPTSLLFDAGYQYESKYIDVTAPSDATVGAFSNNTQVVQVRSINKFRYEVNSVNNGSTGVTITINGTPYNCLCTVTGIGGGSGEPNPITLPPNLYVNARYGETVYINYETNVEATQHFLDKNDGSGYVKIYPTANYTNYSYSTDGIVSTERNHVWKLKVTDYRGNEALSNINITLNNIPDEPDPEPSSHIVLEQQYATSHGCVPNCPDKIDWKYKPRQGHGMTIPNSYLDNTPWKSFGQWLTVYKENGKSLVENVGVELAEFKMWRYNTTTNEWVLINDTFDYGAFYLEDFWDDGAKPLNTHKILSSDKKTYKCLMDSETSGRCFHPFSSKKNWSDFGFSGSPSYVVSQVKFRLIKWNESGVDNRSNANLTVDVGGDYWINDTAEWDDKWRHNGDFAIGYYKKATSDWQYVYATSCPQSWDKGFPVGTI